MTEKSKELLVNFMKKQASAKISKQVNAKKSTKSLNLDKEKKAKDGEGGDDKNDMTDEERLEEAKKESQGKAKQFDQTGMIKKLFLENIAKYVLMITLLVVLAIGVIKGGPILFEFMHGLLFKVLIGGA